MRAYGAELIEFGRDFDEAREKVEQLQHERGLRYVHSANEPLLHRRRRHLRARDLRGAAGRRRDPGADRRRQRRLRLLHRAQRRRQPARKSSACRRSAPMRSRARGRAARASSASRADTFAEGMATRVTFDLHVRHPASSSSTTIVTLTEEELADGVRLALRATHNLAEGAGAAPLAAAMKLRAQLAGKKVVCVMSGGNIDRATLRTVLG